ncbi:hypothetical protein B7494_g1071 [Chlorociboria aeruginascens]|nr:hypothetical protein B7494_g1071 [Chlorociboria aeruginascens]
MSEVPAVDDSSLEKKSAETNLQDGRTQSNSADKALESLTAPSTESSSVAASLREKQSVPLKTPIVDPAASAKPPIAADLTADQQLKYEAVLEAVKGWKEIPSTIGKGGPITDNEIMWLTRECLLRYLRATKWSTSEAIKRLLGTLTWRRDYGVEDLTGDYISPENETGKQMIVGYDNGARPCLYLNPGRQNTEPSPRQVQHLVFMVEHVLSFTVPGQETLALLINFKSSKSRTNTAPGIGQGRECLNILQTHYPERLGRALIVNVPWVVWGFFKLITPFIDPLTREKLKFNEDMRQHVPPEQLWTEFQGDLEFEYEHETYWPALLKLCEERRAEYRERWAKAGKHYGESESYLKGANVPRVGQSTQEEAPAVVKETERGEPVEKDSAPVQSHGTQANGNLDILAQTPAPTLTTEGDRL